MPELGCAPPRAPFGGGEGGVGGGYNPCGGGGGGCAPQLAPSLPPLQSPQLFRRSLSVRWVENKFDVAQSSDILNYPTPSQRPVLNWLCRTSDSTRLNFRGHLRDSLASGCETPEVPWHSCLCPSSGQVEKWQSKEILSCSNEYLTSSGHVKNNLKKYWASQMNIYPDEDPQPQRLEEFL